MERVAEVRLRMALEGVFDGKVLLDMSIWAGDIMALHVLT